MIELRNLGIRAGQFSLGGISLKVETGQYAILMGRTGRGKTTILEAICGLRQVVAGEIVLDGQAVTHWPPGTRNIGYVPQDLAMFPTMSVREHLEFALRRRKVPRAAISQRVSELARMLGIEPLLARRPQGLSGGESQRVALGRALSYQPSVLLLDEPLSALDEATREEMYALLKRVQQQTGVTTIHVTHSRTEAETLADRLFELVDGRILERTGGSSPSDPEETVDHVPSNGEQPRSEVNSKT